MNMNRTIGNEELAYLFEDDSYIANKRNKTVKKTSPEYLALEKLYGNFEVKLPEKGAVSPSVYVGHKGDQYLFEVAGYKDYVRVDDKPNEEKYLKNIEIGDVVDVLVAEINEKNYLIRGSIATLYESRAHANLKSLNEGESVTVLVKALNPAGYEVEIYNGGVTLPGFMPNTLAGINKLVDPTSIVGTIFEVMIESFSEQEGTYIVSRRKYLHTLSGAAIKELNQETVYNGHVTGTAPFGVFVEWEEIYTGLIHKSEFESDDELSKLCSGDEIEFYVKEIKENNKLTLTLDRPLERNVILYDIETRVEEGTIEPMQALIKHKRKVIALCTIGIIIIPRVS
jgi:ribosomal protein S1